MKRMLKMTLLFLKANLLIAVHYRENLYGGILSSLLWIALSIISISVLTFQAPEIGGWNRYELFVVQGVYSIVLGLMYFFVIENMKKLTQLIYRGGLDLVLTKPFDSQFMVSIGDFRVYQLSRIVSGVMLVFYSLYMLKIQLNFFQIAGFMVFMAMSLIVIYSIWFLLTTLSIWLVNLFNLYQLLIHLTGTTRYPLEILKYISKYMFYVTLPLVVITTVPAQVLINKFDAGLAIWAVVIAGSLFVISRKFWFFALKYYASASS